MVYLKFFLFYVFFFQTINFGHTHICEDIFLTESLLKKKAYEQLQKTGEIVKGDFKSYSLTLNQDFDSALSLLRKEGDLLQRTHPFTLDQILLSKVAPKYLKGSFKRYRERGFKQTKNEWVFPKLPTGISLSNREKQFYRAFKDIYNMLNDKNLVFEYMQRLEDSVILYSKLNNKYFHSLDKLEQVEIKQRMLKKVLDKSEVDQGFLSTHKDHYEPLDLPDDMLSGHEWNELLSRKQMFNDTAFLKADEFSLAKGLNPDEHGQLTHRIQFFVIGEHIKRNPSAFKNIKGADIFKMMGDTQFNHKIGLGGKFNTLWTRTVDAIEVQSFHCPEYFRKSFYQWPDLGLWY